LGLNHSSSYQNLPFNVSGIKCQGQIDIGMKEKGRKIVGSKRAMSFVNRPFLTGPI